MVALADGSRLMSLTVLMMSWLFVLDVLYLTMLLTFRLVMLTFLLLGILLARLFCCRTWCHRLTTLRTLGVILPLSTVPAVAPLRRLFLTVLSRTFLQHLLPKSGCGSSRNLVLGCRQCFNFRRIIPNTP